MKRTIFTCDFCGKEISKAHYVSIGNLSLRDWEKEVCKECAGKTIKLLEESFGIKKEEESKPS